MKNNYITIVGNRPISFDLHESMHIGPVIASANNNKRNLAAEELGISERTLYRKINDYDL